MICTQILSSPRSVAQSVSLQEPNRSPTGAASPNGLFIIVAVSHVVLSDVFVRSRGVPETRRGLFEGLPPIWTGDKTGEKKRLRRRERQQLWVWHSSLDHTDHRGPSHENILLSVYLINAT